jgi:hypothetical protein
MSHAPAELPALEVLDAAGVVPAKRVEPTALALVAGGYLRTADRLEVHPANSSHAVSDTLIAALLDAVERGLAQRYAGAYRLTPAGDELLTLHDARAREDARVESARLALLALDELWHLADRAGSVG